MTKSPTRSTFARVCGLFLSLMCANLWASDFSPLVTRYAALESVLSLHQTQQDRLQARLKKNANQIKRLKSQLDGPSYVLKSFKLDSLMKDAQRLANESLALQTKQSQLMKERRNLEGQILRALDAEIGAQALRVKNRSLSLEDRRQAYQAYIDRSERRELWATRIQSHDSAGLAPQRLRDLSLHPDRQAIMKVLERDIRAEVKKIERELAGLQKQRFMRAELETFLEEEAFFAEATYVRTFKTTKSEDPSSGEASDVAGAEATSNENPQDPTVAGVQDPGAALAAQDAAAGTQAALQGAQGPNELGMTDGSGVAQPAPVSPAPTQPAMTMVAAQTPAPVAMTAIKVQDTPGQLAAPLPSDTMMGPASPDTAMPPVAPRIDVEPRSPDIGQAKGTLGDELAKNGQRKKNLYSGASPREDAHERALKERLRYLRHVTAELERSR